MSESQLNQADQVTVLALHRVSEGYNRLPWQFFSSLWEHYRTKEANSLELGDIGFELERQPISEDLSYSVTIQQDDWNELLQLSSDDSTEEALSMRLLRHFELLEEEVLLRKKDIIEKIKDIRKHILIRPQEYTTAYEYQGKYLSDYIECVADAFIHAEFKTPEEDLEINEILNNCAPTPEAILKLCRILDKMLVPVARLSWSEVTSKPPEPLFFQDQEFY